MRNLLSMEDANLKTYNALNVWGIYLFFLVNCFRYSAINENGSLDGSKDAPQVSYSHDSEPMLLPDFSFSLCFNLVYSIDWA